DAPRSSALSALKSLADSAGQIGGATRMRGVVLLRSFTVCHSGPAVSEESEESGEHVADLACRGADGALDGFLGQQLVAVGAGIGGHDINRHAPQDLRPGGAPPDQWGGKDDAALAPSPLPFTVTHPECPGLFGGFLLFALGKFVPFRFGEALQLPVEGGDIHDEQAAQGYTAADDADPGPPGDTGDTGGSEPCPR